MCERSHCFQNFECLFSFSIPNPNGEWGVGTGGSKLPALCAMHSIPAPAPFLWHPPFFDCEVLGMVSYFPLFLPLPTLLELSSPVPFPPPILPDSQTPAHLPALSFLIHSYMKKKSFGVTTKPSNRAALPSSCGS